MRNSYCNSGAGSSNSGPSSYNGMGPAQRTITGVPLGGKEYAAYPEPA